MTEATRDEKRAAFIDMAMALPDDKQLALFRFLMMLINGNKRAERMLYQEGIKLEQVLSSFSLKR